MRIVFIVFVFFFFFAALTGAYSQNDCRKCGKVANKIIGSWSTYKIITEFNGTEVISEQDVIPAGTLTLHADSTFKIVAKGPRTIKGKWKVVDKGKLLVLDLQETIPEHQGELGEWRYPIRYRSRNRLTLLTTFFIRSASGENLTDATSSVTNTKVFYRRIKKSR